MGARRPGGLLHLPVGGIQSSVPDIFPDCAGKEMGVLKHHGDIAAQVISGNIPDIHTVYGDLSFINVIKTVYQIGYCGFAGPCGAHKGDFLSRFCVQGNVL